MNKKKPEEIIDNPKLEEYIDNKGDFSNAKRITEVVDQWYGDSPAVIGITDTTTLPVYQSKDVVDLDILVRGFQQRERMEDGKTSKYLMVFALKDYRNYRKENHFLCFMRGDVVLRKLNKVYAENNLPIVGKYTKKKSQKGGKTYWDFI